MTKKQKMWLIVVAAILIVGVAVYILLSRWMNTASNGTVHVGDTTSQAATETQPVTLSSEYFTTQLPAGFSEKRRTESPDSNATLLQLFATGGLNNQQDVAITVGTLQSGGLSEVGDYNLRTAKPEMYEKFDPASLPAGAVAYRTISGAPGFVVFWPSGNRYTEISFNGEGGATLQQLQTTYLQVIGSWQSK